MSTTHGYKDGDVVRIKGTDFEGFVRDTYKGTIHDAAGETRIPTWGVLISTPVKDGLGIAFHYSIIHHTLLERVEKPVRVTIEVLPSASDAFIVEAFRNAVRKQETVLR